MWREGSDAIAVMTAQDQLAGLLTVEAVLQWISAGAGNADERRIGELLSAMPPVVGAAASVADGVLALAETGAAAVVITRDGTTGGALDGVVTRGEFARFFSQQPSDLLSDIRRARSPQGLAALSQRVRAFSLERLTGAAATDWLAKLTTLVDAAVVSRLLELDEQPRVGTWCFCGASGRGESLTRLAPLVVVLVGEDEDVDAATEQHGRIASLLAECGYLADPSAGEVPFQVGRVSDWQEHFRGWIHDPVIREMYRARTLFDLRPVAGVRERWQSVTSAANLLVDRDFLYVLANDCLANLPPLTFYEDAVVDNVGEQLATFELADRALRPLVDVARVLGMAAGAVFGYSTLERFAAASRRMPAHEQIFSEAVDTFRVVLWHQARIGIAQGTSGAEISPKLLSRSDRHVLKTGFRSILRLLQFTGDREWLNTL
jgi:CBS domain-containing protein